MAGERSMAGPLSPKAMARASVRAWGTWVATIAWSPLARVYSTSLLLVSIQSFAGSAWTHVSAYSSPAYLVSGWMPVSVPVVRLILVSHGVPLLFVQARTLQVPETGSLSGTRPRMPLWETWMG